ncbi:MAG: SGNH/GDSL hydrolase family protein [Mesorhizobium sp.]|nr:MAG: SGNH/GDSL hydrolase family protein [Mesorhizobium sp.]
MANEIRDAFNAAYADGPVGSPTQPPKVSIREIGGLIQGTVDDLDVRLDVVGGVPAEIAALDTRVDAAEAELVDHETRIDSVESLISIGAKTPVAVTALSTTNIVIASGVVNGATIGGVAVATGQTVVLAGQTAPAENGAYIVAAAGAASRSTDFDTSAELLSATFSVTSGTHAGAVWAIRNTAAITVGTTAIVISKAYDLPGGTAQVEVTAARQGHVDLAANLTAMKASTSALALVSDTLSLVEGLSIPTAKMTEAVGSITPYVHRSYTVANATTYEHVVVAKASERGALQLFCNAAGVGYVVNFDLVDGTYSGTGANLVSASMVNLGAGWWECKAVILTSGSISAQIQTRLSAGAVYPYTGDGTSGVFVRSIILRVQNTTTNLFPSSDPVDATFTKVSVTVANTATVESKVLPPLQTIVDDIDILTRGRLTADKIIEMSGSGSPVIYHTVTITVGDAIVFDVIAKAGERTRLNLFSNSGFSFNVTFDLINGTVTGTGGSILALGNGWYRCRVTGTATATASANFQHRIYPASGGQPYSGDGVSGLYLQSSSITKNGGGNILGFSTNYASTYWTKGGGLTVSPNSGRYLGVLSDPASIGGSAYDDGSAALVGKKWTAIGSSITIGAYYATLLAGQTGMVLTNLGVSGSALGLSTTAYPSYGMSAPIATMPTDTELATIEPGPNAFGAQETPLGVLGDTTYATHYGSLWAAIADIRTRAPGAKIVMIGTYSGGPGHATSRIGRVNGQGNTMDQFFKAEREVAKLLSVPLIDIGGESGIGYLTSTLYMSDELHPNAAGSLRHATFCAGELRRFSKRGLFLP